jgi:AcrR family transcriptional regulator
MTEAERKRGRPRTPDLEKRVFAAALDEYARTGWASFTMDGVARRAGVGKSALYLRWPDRQRVLLDSMEALTRPLTVHDTGSVRGDVTGLATDLMAHFLDPLGWASLRVAVDSVSEAADLDPLHERIVRMHTEAATRMFLSAIERGELPADAPVPAAVETLYGAVFIHALALPSEQRAHARAHPAEHAAPLAAFVLAGLGLGD